MSEVTGDSANIEFGPCQVMFKTEDLGYFKGGVEFNAGAEFLDYDVDQSTMQQGSKVIKETAVATVTMAETVLSKLKTVLVTGTHTLDTGGDKEKIGVGGKQIVDADYGVLKITPVVDGSGTLSTDDNEIVTIHKALPKPQFKKAYNRDGIRVVPVEFHGYEDHTQPAGERLYLLGDTTAAAV
jgi:hypothetical protein